MDSVSQFVLGAGIAELMLGKKIGNKAFLVGGLVATLPDLDIVLNPFLKDPLAHIRLHRSYSHALVPHVLASFPLAWILLKSFKGKIKYAAWYWLVFLALSTHALLDSMTTYGTRLFLPFTQYQVATNNVSIIDPLFTIPFLVLLLACLFLNKTNPVRMKVAKAAMTYALCYLSLTMVSKYFAHRHFTKELNRQGIAFNSLSSVPTFFNNILWSGIAVNDSMLYVGEYSFLQSDSEIKFLSYQRNIASGSSFNGPELQTLTWFSKGYYFLQPAGNDSIHFYITKWGRANFSESAPEKAFIFYHTLVKSSETIRVIAHEPRFKRGQFREALNGLRNRIVGKSY